jgi:hypothetical protein
MFSKGLSKLLHLGLEHFEVLCGQTKAIIRDTSDVGTGQGRTHASVHDLHVKTFSSMKDQ